MKNLPQLPNPKVAAEEFSSVRSKLQLVMGAVAVRRFLACLAAAPGDRLGVSNINLHRCHTGAEPLM